MPLGELLKEGTRWNIRNGATVPIWKDKWLPTSNDNRVITPPQIFDQNSMVTELIDHENHTWRTGLIRQIFNPLQAAEILNIPLGDTNQRDYLVWQASRNGSFTVKSAYHLAQKMERRQLQAYEPGSSKEYDGRWDKIWKSKTQPKIKHLAWCACQDSLPTRANLCRRGLNVDVYCPLCSEDYETQTHIFLDCRVAKEVWAKSPFRLNICERSQRNFEAWFFHLCDAFDDETRGLFITLLYG